MKTIYYCVAILIVTILTFILYRQWYFVTHLEKEESRMKKLVITPEDCHYAASIFIDLLEKGYKTKRNSQLYILSESLICPPDCRNILEKEKQTIESYYPEKSKISCPVDTPNH